MIVTSDSQDYMFTHYTGNINRCLFRAVQENGLWTAHLITFLTLKLAIVYCSSLFQRTYIIIANKGRFPTSTCDRKHMFLTTFQWFEWFSTCYLQAQTFSSNPDRKQSGLVKTQQKEIVRCILVLHKHRRIIDTSIQGFLFSQTWKR